MSNGVNFYNHLEATSSVYYLEPMALLNLTTYLTIEQLLSPYVHHLEPMVLGAQNHTSFGLNR